MSKYTLYSYGHGDVFSKYTTHPRPWIIKVKAKSIKQAYYLVANQEISENGSVGIVFVDHSDGPEMLKEWPFDFNISEVDNNWKK